MAMSAIQENPDVSRQKDEAAQPGTVGDAKKTRIVNWLTKLIRYDDG